MNPKLQKLLQRERRIKLITVLAILIVCTVSVLAIDNLLIACVLAFVMNYLLAPIVDLLERRGLSRQASIFIPFFAAAFLIAFGIYKILPLLTAQAVSLEAKLPVYQVDLMNLVSRTETKFKGFFKLYNINISETINTWIINKTANLSAALPSAISGSLTVLMLSPLFAFFMLQDGRRASRTILALVPNNLFELALNLHHQLNEQMGGFIRARFLEAAIVGAVVWIGLQILGFPYAVLLGAFAGLTNLIPYIGPIVGAVPPVLIALISEEPVVFHTVGLSLIAVTAVYLFAQLIDVVFIIPMVVARIVNLHPITVIIVIIAGAQVMGVLGMMIAIPVTSAIKLIFQTFYRHMIEFRA
jgi:putative permease